MNRYIALLRGINVSGQKLIAMSALKEMLTDAGFDNVITYIQSGNVIVDHSETNTLKIADLIRRLILQKFGYDVITIVFTKETLLRFLEENPFLKETSIDPKHLYFTFLETQPSLDKIEKIQSLEVAPERFAITHKMIYVFCANGYGKTKIHNQFFEQQLKVSASTRNLNTVQKLLELAH